MVLDKSQTMQALEILRRLVDASLSCDCITKERALLQAATELFYPVPDDPIEFLVLDVYNTGWSKPTRFIRYDLEAAENEAAQYHREGVRTRLYSVKEQRGDSRFLTDDLHPQQTASHITPGMSEEEYDGEV